MKKTMVLDLNTFSQYGESNRYIDGSDLCSYLKQHHVNTYLLRNIDDQHGFTIPNSIKGQIFYSKPEIRKTPCNLIYKILTESKVQEIKDLLIVSSDQELLKIFEPTNIETCLIYKNMYDVVETKTTHEFNQQVKVKKLI